MRRNFKMKKFLRPIFAVVSAMLAVVLTISMTVSVSATAPDVLYVPYNTFTEDTTPDTLPEPVIMSFTDEDPWHNDGGWFDRNDPQKYSFFEDTGGEGELYKFVSVKDANDDESTALQLLYDEYDSLPSYRVMPKFVKNSDNSLPVELTEDHKYISIIYMTKDELPGTLTITNNLTGDTVTLANNTSVSQGEWVCSYARDISSSDILARFLNGGHCMIAYRAFNSDSTDAEFYIKEIGFFGSEEQAYDHYENSYELPDGVDFSTMTFDIVGTGTTLDGTKYGVHSINDETGDLDITYAKSTNAQGYEDYTCKTSYPIKYMAKVKFTSTDYINSNHRFMRVLYAADHPDSFTEPASMYMLNDGYSKELIRLSNNVTDTNGNYVLTDTVYLPDGIISRLSATGAYTALTHCSLFTNTNVEGATYSIKAIYFFPSKEAANAFTYTAPSSTVTLNGNDITNYQIVIAEDAPIKVVEAAKTLVSSVRVLTGETLSIVTDSAPEDDYEILVGVSNRELSYSKNDEDEYQSAFAFMDGDTFVVTSPHAPSTAVIMKHIVEDFMGAKLLAKPKSVSIAEDFSLEYEYSRLVKQDWDAYDETVADPDRFYDRFGFDNGFWTEENAADNWHFEDGTYNSDGNGKTLSYIHTFEPNVEYNMDIMYTDADSDGDMGLMLRYNSADAYVKAGYDFETSKWHITSREGADFYKVRHASSEEVEIEPGEWYSLKFIVNGTTATLSVDGEDILYVDDLTHVTPGRIAVYADDVAMSVKNADIYMLSGEGTVIPNVAHTKLETNAYTEGGTVHELNDGTLVYHHQNGYGFYSNDNGVSWVEREPRFPTSYGYMNVIRLLPRDGQDHGDFMQIITGDDGKKYSATSNDEGKNWTIGKNPICSGKYQSTTAVAVNMNDKLFQSAKNGRIFYSQSYEATSGSVDGRKVFCEFYYSDDHGDTWTKSNTDSWTIEGNGNQTYFGECKILECEDGTIRMYNSWNDYGCIVYSESTDGGANFGPLVKMTDFPCSRSSMQFVRDPYADNATTYYMVWVNAEGYTIDGTMPRARLTLAKSTDGKEWEILGDIWRWESNYAIGAHINHVVDPFIQVTEDYVIVGSGISENIGLSTDAAISSSHHSQRQHIYSIKKSTLGAELPPIVYYGDANSDGKATLEDLTIFNRYLASWTDYNDEVYDFTTFDLNDDGAITPLDSVLFARHLADWDKYRDIELIKYIPNVSNDRYIITSGSTRTPKVGTASEVGLPAAIYGNDNASYYRYDNYAVELETGEKVPVYSTVKLNTNRVYRVDENNVAYVTDELIGTLDNTSHNNTNHWRNAKVNKSYWGSRNYVKYGITDTNSSSTVNYDDWKWYQTRLYSASATDATKAEANAKILEYAKALTAVINTAIDSGLNVDNADYSSVASSNLNGIKAFVKPYIEAGVKLAADGSDIVFETIPQSVYDIELLTVNAAASFDSDGNLTLTMKGESVIDASDNVKDLVVVNQSDLAIWRYSEKPETTLKVLHNAPQVVVVGKPGQNDAYGKFFERSLKDGVAVVMIGTINAES